MADVLNDVVNSMERLSTAVDVLEKHLREQLANAHPPASSTLALSDMLNAVTYAQEPMQKATRAVIYAAKAYAARETSDEANHHSHSLSQQPISALDLPVVPVSQSIWAPDQDAGEW